MSHYHAVDSIARDEAMVAFDSGHPDQICDALIRLTCHDPDWRWVQDQCVFWCGHANVDIRGLAASCLGHLARIHHELNLKTVLPVLKRLLADSSVAGRVEDALDDIDRYLDVDVRNNL